MKIGGIEPILKKIDRTPALPLAGGQTSGELDWYPLQAAGN